MVEEVGSAAAVVGVWTAADGVVVTAISVALEVDEADDDADDATGAEPDPPTVKSTHDS